MTIFVFITHYIDFFYYLTVMKNINDIQKGERKIDRNKIIGHNHTYFFI